MTATVLVGRTTLRWFCCSLGDEDEVGEDKGTIPVGKMDEMGRGLESELNFEKFLFKRCSDTISRWVGGEKYDDTKEAPDGTTMEK